MAQIWKIEYELSFNVKNSEGHIIFAKSKKGNMKNGNWTGGKKSWFP